MDAEIYANKRMGHKFCERMGKNGCEIKLIIYIQHSTAEILFNGSHLLGTMTSRSDMDTIVVTHDVQICDYNQQAECIIEEMGFNEQMKMERRRTCENNKLFICKFCKVIQNQNLYKFSK